jgi:hypothetical protein
MLSVWIFYYKSRNYHYYLIKEKLNKMAGRPRKSQSAEVVSSSDGNNGNELIEKLLQKIAELESRIDKASTVTKVEEIESEDEFKKNKIDQEDYIKVVSLCPYMLNLSMEKNGQGKTFTFYEFGEVKRILYGELARVLESNRSFLEAGYFYIMDQRCIRRHGLNDLYEKILTKEKIEKILEGKSNDIVSLFKSGTPIQQSLIVEMLINKLASNPDSIDLNMIDKISRASGVKIAEKAEEARDFADSIKNKE